MTRRSCTLLGTRPTNDELAMFHRVKAERRRRNRASRASRKANR